MIASLKTDGTINTLQAYVLRAQNRDHNEETRKHCFSDLDGISQPVRKYAPR